MSRPIPAPARPAAGRHPTDLTHPTAGRRAGGSGGGGSRNAMAPGGGLPKVRHYGFLSPAASMSLERVRWLVALWAGLTYVLRPARAEMPPPVGPTCPACGGRLVRLGFLPAAAPTIFDTS